MISHSHLSARVAGPKKLTQEHRRLEVAPIRRLRDRTAGGMKR
jgi:hypothetical protein